ncbi:GL24642 [Drosophila persimilis]|uniref:Enhancer of split malpha protein n=2 Tax=pseudoobscura subgroup TaxID=32358 RepID=Q2M180_DROPS|nr:enhancer of split malpha protein [Drosophila pseudoobscura]XP_002022255.1 enhancer of split malpha protein [Drosophila persimilis]XP_017139073.1 enhancer of split malpha protein [Drosophila miranda]EDW26259.1 GL24642 [Drosophila persimilis]
MSFITREYKFESSMVQQKSDQHTMAMRSLKKLVKPLLRLVKKKQLLRKTLAEIQNQNDINASLEDMRKDPAVSCDNMANEQLEQRLYNDLKQCPSNVAMIVQQGQQQHVVPVQPEQTFIPVHFARTSSGTFFWTTAEGARQHQEQQLRQQFDRWVQA